MATIETLKNEKPKIADSFLNLVQTIRSNIAFDEKTGQLHVISILTAIGAFDGVEVHTKMAMDAGATRDEIVSSVAICLPTCGIGPTMKAMESAVSAMEKK